MGKNLIGAFHQPTVVFMDMAFREGSEHLLLLDCAFHGVSFWCFGIGMSSLALTFSLTRTRMRKSTFFTCLSVLSASVLVLSVVRSASPPFLSFCLLFMIVLLVSRTLTSLPLQSMDSRREIHCAQSVSSELASPRSSRRVRFGMPLCSNCANRRLRSFNLESVGF